MSLLHERIKANYWKGVEVGAILYLRMMDLDLLLTHLTFKRFSLRTLSTYSRSFES